MPEVQEQRYHGQNPLVTLITLHYLKCNLHAKDTGKKIVKILQYLKANETTV